MFLPPEATNTFSAASSQLFKWCFHPACCGDQGPADPQSAFLYLSVGSCPSLPATCPFSSTTSSLEASSLPPLGSDLSAVSFSFYVKNNSSFCILVHSGRASQVGTVVKNPSANARDAGRYRFYPWAWKIPWSRKW